MCHRREGLDLLRTGIGVVEHVVPGCLAGLHQALEDLPVDHGADVGLVAVAVLPAALARLAADDGQCERRAGWLFRWPRTCPSGEPCCGGAPEKRLSQEFASIEW